MSAYGQRVLAYRKAEGLDEEPVIAVVARNDPDEQEKYGDRLGRDRPQGIAGTLGEKMHRSRRNGEHESSPPEGRIAAHHHRHIVSRPRSPAGASQRRE